MPGQQTLTGTLVLAPRLGASVVLISPRLTATPAVGSS